MSCSNIPNKCIIIVGKGALPHIVTQYLESQQSEVKLLLLNGTCAPWLQQRNYTRISITNFIEILNKCLHEGWRYIVLAGGVERPRLDSCTSVPEYNGITLNLETGDDQVLRQIIAIIEKLGFNVIGAHEIVTDLINHSGILTKVKPSEKDISDVNRAKMIVEALGRVDVGQSAIVVQGVCLAVESVTGTDSMIRHAAMHIDRYRTYANGSRGILYKGAKPGQDMRVDLPVIGPDTLKLAAAAGLAGIVIVSGQVMIIDRKKVLQIADSKGMFIWSYPVSN